MLMLFLCFIFFSHRQTIGKIWKNHLLRQGTWLALKLCPWRTCPSWIFAAAVARRTMLRWKMPRAMTLWKKATYAIEMWRLKNHCVYFRIIGVAEAFPDICFSSFIWFSACDCTDDQVLIKCSCQEGELCFRCLKILTYMLHEPKHSKCRWSHPDLPCNFSNDPRPKFRL